MTGLVKHNNTNIYERKYVSDSLPFEEHLDYRPALILYKISNSQNNEVHNIAYVSVLSVEDTVICNFKMNECTAIMNILSRSILVANIELNSINILKQ